MKLFATRNSYCTYATKSRTCYKYNKYEKSLQPLVSRHWRVEYDQPTTFTAFHPTVMARIYISRSTVPLSAMGSFPAN